jgi:hypothetical protein
MIEDQEETLASSPEPERLRMTLAIRQVEEFLRDARDPRELLEAFGLPADGPAKSD